MLKYLQIMLEKKNRKNHSKMVGGFLYSDWIGPSMDCYEYSFRC